MDATLIATGGSFAASGIVSLVAWGLRGEVNTLRGEIKTLRAEQAAGLVKADNSGKIDTVRAELATLRAEQLAGLAAAENRFFERVNGNYIRKELHNEMVARVDRIENKVDELE
jgi:ribosomal protein L29